MVANTIVVMDEKGGAAKTTLSLLLAQALGNAGYKTCAGDLDGQCNLTTAAGVDEDEQEGIYSVLKKEVEVADAIVPVDGFDLLPGSKLMKNWEITTILYSLIHLPSLVFLQQVPFLRIRKFMFLFLLHLINLALKE